MTGSVGSNRALPRQRLQHPAAGAALGRGDGHAGSLVLGPRLRLALACLLAALVLALAAPGRGVAGEVAWERYSDLGRKALQDQDYGEARAMFEAALREAEQISPWDMRVGHSLNDLAATYYAEGGHAEVAELLTRALQVIEVGLGPDHPDVAQVLKNLAAVEYLQNDYASAETKMLRAVEIWEASLGGDNHSVAAALNNLAGIYEAQGRHPEAAIALERSLLIWEKIVGPDHEAVVESRRQLNELQRVHGLLPSAVAADRSRQVAPAARAAGLEAPTRPQPAAAIPAPAAAPEPAPAAAAAPAPQIAAPDTIFLEPAGQAAPAGIDAAASPARSPPVEAAPARVQVAQAAPAVRLINLHLGSFRSQASAEDSRSRVLDSYRDILAAQEIWVERAQAGPRGDFFRVMAGPYESASVAQDVCTRLQSLRQDCFLRQR
ncbi:MAG: tetratricopeptide repeat protein [Kiloniellales bacterium]|nr:tetratricopeptide repeat protein [Kiloniellales bacterium]